MKHVLVPIEATKTIAELLLQAASDDMILSLEDAEAVWRELVCVAALETEEGRDFFVKANQQ